MIILQVNKRTFVSKVFVINNHPEESMGTSVSSRLNRSLWKWRFANMWSTCHTDVEGPSKVTWSCQNLRSLRHKFYVSRNLKRYFYCNKIINDALIILSWRWRRGQPWIWQGKRSTWSRCCSKTKITMNVQQNFEGISSPDFRHFIGSRRKRCLHLMGFIVPRILKGEE